MTATSLTIRDAIAAETAAAEAAILAERMRGIGAWFAYAALDELATARRTRAHEIKIKVRQTALAG